MKCLDREPFPPDFESQVIDAFTRSSSRPSTARGTGATRTLDRTVQQDRELCGRRDQRVQDWDLVHVEQSMVGRGGRGGIGQGSSKGFDPDRGITELFQSMNKRGRGRPVRGMALINGSVEVSWDRDDGCSETETQ